MEILIIITLVACVVSVIISVITLLTQKRLALTGLYEVTAATVLFLILPERAGQAAVRFLSLIHIFPDKG